MTRNQAINLVKLYDNHYPDEYIKLYLDYYKMIVNEISNNPDGPNVSYDPDEPYIKKRVMKGGSFMCNDSYCSGYRNSMRMKSSPDTGSLHTGFRTVMDAVSP